MMLYEQTAHQLGKGLRAKDFSAVELFNSIYARLEETEPQIKAYLALTKLEGLECAAKIDGKIHLGEELHPLAGIPGGIKDVISTAGIKTTCASKMLENYTPTFDATVVQKLKEFGATCLGKTNMDEFAMGSSTETSVFQFTANPWDIERVPGGSSGGSAAAVAVGSAVWSLGSDTGGSIRQPASYCGVVGMKPTYGRVSRYGAVAFASSMDQIGPFTRDVRDAAIVLGAISGHDSRDSTSSSRSVPDYTALLGQTIKGMKIGLPKEYFTEDLSPIMKKVVDEAVIELEKQGAIIKVVSLPHSKYALSVYYALAPGEASSNLGRFDGVRFGLRSHGDDVAEMTRTTRTQGFGTEVKQRLLLGTYTLCEENYQRYFLQALKVRRMIQNDFNDVFQEVDIILTPTTNQIAFKKGEITDPLSMYLEDLYTVPTNLSGNPAISVQAGLDKGMPLGLQFIGKPWGEAELLKVAYAYEQANEFHTLRPEWKGGKAR